ncbi:N-acetyl-gamma-glutamyl-phosphate reductase [Halovulum sp. GXIMD14793]
MATKVFVDGAVGTTGLQIEARLHGCTDIERIVLAEENRKDAAARAEALRQADIAILCLPDQAAREAAELVAGQDTRLIDASTAHRTHPNWVFGFPELTATQRGAIADARYVSNPGCHAIGAISLIRPLREAGLMAADQPISIQSLSGYSGGGKAMIAEFEGADGPDGFIYATSQSHKHLPEICKHGLLDRVPVFSPTVGGFAQGMVLQVFLHLDQLPGGPSRADLHAVLAAHYAGGGDVHVAGLEDEPVRLDPQALNGTNDMKLYVLGSAGQGTVVLAAVLDNLGKGASGSAVRNLNLMIGG